MTASIIIGPLFVEEQLTAGSVTSTVTEDRLESMLRRFVIPELQQSGILDTTIFMQEEAPPHTGTCIKQFTYATFHG